MIDPHSPRSTGATQFVDPDHPADHRGDFDDLPLDEILAAFDEVHGEGLRTGSHPRDAAFEAEEAR